MENLDRDGFLAYWEPRFEPDFPVAVVSNPSGELAYDYPPVDCPSIPLCGIPDIFCNLKQLLPTGTAWTIPEYGEDNCSDTLAQCAQLICSTYSPAAPCEPVFVANLLKLFSMHYQRIDSDAARLVALLNPATSSDRAYWLRKWGLFDLIDFSVVQPDCGPDALAFRAEVQGPVFQLTAAQRAAVEYGLIRAAIITNRADFVPSISNINLALSRLGYKVFERPSGDYPVDPGGQLLGSGLYGPQHPGQIYFENGCCDVKLKLHLAPSADTLEGAPDDPCETETQDVMSTSVLTDPCRDNQTIYIAGKTAANFLVRIFPAWQPYSLTVAQ
jgi:hypothetical protein